MNILIIGLGSMGKRRLRLIREMFPEFNCFGVDERKDRREEVTKLYGIICESSIDCASKKHKIDSAFVCTSPLSHSVIIKKCLENKWNVFTELNLVDDGYKDNMLLAEKNGVTLFLSSTFLYREEIRYIMKKIDDTHKWNYIYHVGQYLPDWHPWENYKDFFVGNKRTNGCREIMAIELPWIIKTFGDIESVCVISDKISDLKLDYNDNYMIQVKHTNGNKGAFIVDIVSPIAVRKLEVYSENNYIKWNGTPDSLFEYDKSSGSLKSVELNETAEHEEGYCSFVVENAYKNEIQEFMDVVLQNKQQLYGFAEDLKTLRFINKMEESF